MYIGVARSSYRQHSCDDVTKLGLCDWFTNELTDWRRRRRRRRRKEITYETLGLHLVQKLLGHRLLGAMISTWITEKLSVVIITMVVLVCT